IGADGVVKLVNADGKELAVSKAKLSEATEPELTPDVKKLVVLPLPYRSRGHVVKTLRIEDKPVGDLPFEKALVIFAGEFGSQNANEANNVFRQSFHNRDQRQIGFYV